MKQKCGWRYRHEIILLMTLSYTVLQTIHFIFISGDAVQTEAVETNDSREEEGYTEMVLVLLL